MKRIAIISVLLFSALVLRSQEKVILTGKQRLSEWENHVKMAESSPFQELPWIQIGPKLNSGRIAGIVGIPG